MTSFDDEVAGAEDVAEQARRVAPVVWLLGKVQAGKSSIVCGLTGADRAEIGSGFRACTRSSDIYELPPEAPVIRFLDTRGIGEAGYDPNEDLAVAEAASHCTIAVVRAMDLQQERIVEILKLIRKKHPDWPVLVAQTHLHEAYAPGDDHPLPYPYGADGAPVAGTGIPENLRRALAHQRELFAELPGNGPVAFVPLDFTLDGDGFTPRLYGLVALQERLAEIGPAALQAALADSAEHAAEAGGDAGVHRLIVGHAAAASAADLIPIAAVAAVPAVQGRLLQTLGQRHGLEWSRATALKFAGALGIGFLARYAAGFGIRQLTKLIPVYGQTAGAAAAAATSFATTYALGKAAVYFLAQEAEGRSDDAAV
ncbi:MAG: GTPase family protein, partial [Hyphomicrobiaceae bacterium]